MTTEIDDVEVIGTDHLPWEEVELPPVDEPMALVTIPQHHVVVGMGTLAEMSEEEFQAKLAVMQKGQERLRTIQEKLLTRGEDYGMVKGIDKPFLHQPGAEKLANFYGLAVRQEAKRIDGRRAMSKYDGYELEDGEWLSPPYAYEVTSFVHLGNFDGPIVAQGFGTANAWEDKYRYRWQNPTCPKCGREGLIKRKSPPNLAGKWNCPSWQNMGGCNSVFEPNDPQIQPAAKVEYENPHSNAETILLMAAKRSLVAGVRRATGTSGLFTQDEDSPSVQAQAASSPDDAPPPEPPKIDNVTEVIAAAGGKEAGASMAQLRELVALSQERDLGPAGIAALMKRVLDKDVGETQRAVSNAAKSLTGDEIGKLLNAIRTGEVPEKPAAPHEPSSPGVNTGELPPRATVDAATTLPKRRGRPPGSKNKPKIEDEATPGWPPASSEDM